MRPVAALFLLNGLVVSSVYARLPAIKDRLDLDAGQLSLALLGITVGLLVAQPLTGALVHRRGSAPVAALGAVLCSAAVAGPALAGSLAVLVAAGVALGFGNGMLDVAMNVNAVEVERTRPKPILSRMHALFSIGMLTAAGSAAIVAGAGVSARTHLCVVAAVGVAVGLLVRPHLHREPPPPARKSARPRPSRELVAAGVVAFCVLLCEGAIADWSAVHLRESLDQSAAVAALGLAAFAIAMTVGRLAGDALTVRLGERTHMRAGAALAGGALVLAALAPVGGVSIAAFALAGLGLSALFPLVVRVASRSEPAAPAIAAVSTAGYVGLVAGPPVVGALAEATSLRVALATVLGTLCATAILATGYNQGR